MDIEEQGVKVGLSALIIRNGKILLGERLNTETAPNTFAFPGGKMDYGESPEDGIIREIYEETGLKVKMKEVNFLDYNNEYFPEVKKHYVNLVFIIVKFDGEPENTEPNKCKKWDWHCPYDLPENIFWAIKEVINNNREKIDYEIFKSIINFKAKNRRK